MDRDLDVRTPESIALNYRLAGLGSRFLAVAVDQAIQFALLTLLVVGTIAAALKFTSVSTAHLSAIAERSQALAIALIIVVLFTIFFAYFIVFETVWNGQTPGKRALGIRVVRDGGYPIDFTSALVRNVIRVGEFALGYYLLSAVSTLLSSENKRLGDFAAGTIVVRDAALALPLEELRRRVEPAYAGTRYLSGDERAVVRRFLDRRDVLAIENRRRIAAQLAQRVRDRVPGELQRLDDESLLERL